EHFDSLMIARWMLAIRQKQVFKTPFPGTSDKESIEYSIALSEMFFCIGKTEKGFRALESVYERWGVHQKRHGSFFRDHMIEKAGEHGLSEKEKLFLKEALLYDMYVHPDKLRRYLDMLNKNELRPEAESMVRTLK